MEYCKKNSIKLIVLTHHAPTRRNTLEHQSRSETYPIYEMEYTDLENTLIGHPVALWLFGHTHYTSD